MKTNRTKRKPKPQQLQGFTVKRVEKVTHTPQHD